MGARHMGQEIAEWMNYIICVPVVKLPDIETRCTTDEA